MGGTSQAVSIKTHFDTWLASKMAHSATSTGERYEVIHADGYVLPHPLDKKNFSGKFGLRVEPALHRRLAAKAVAAGESDFANL